MPRAATRWGRAIAANVAPVTAALAHAHLTWPLVATVVLFTGSVLLALSSEAIAVRLGLLEHHTGPKIAGVPLPILAAWPAIVYAFVRGAALLLGPAPDALVAVVAATGATLFDAAIDPVGVRRGRWSYPESPFSEPRFRGIPWWNFAGWFLLVGFVGFLALRV